MKILKTNKTDYKVVVNQDGTLTITDLRKNNASIQNPGALIMSMGGINGVLLRCEEISEEDYAEELEKQKVEKEETTQKIAKDRLERERQIKSEFDEAFSNEITECTIENITVLLRYLNSVNWGMWRLPKMTIGYSCHQYDCNGQTATTITLNMPIEYDGEMLTKFVVGCGPRHLTDYTQLR
ncbi:hypothetical protein HMPREF6745_0814 [Prevotella sp. oral taxon 472 str. F0295]|jgi:hypothetical protein|nr:hypothetical protein [Prevotella sp. oral taxon 472]EEX53700.1 hypothetical protein HMPREF6745_0814 [Prevotella sp. oral taxon 472 str. F0295]